LRRQYLDLIRTRLARGDVRWVATQGLRYLGTVAGERLGRPLTGPLLGTAVVTYRCNYLCSMCELPDRAKRQRQAGVTEFTTEEWLDVVRGFRRLGTTALGITGGEPMLRKDLNEILRTAHDLGMVTHVNTNGHFLEEDRCRALLETGVDSVNVSLDGCEAETHDRIRGVKGSFDRIQEGIARLLRLRRGSLRPRVTFVTVLGMDNLDHARGMLDLARRLGVDRVGFIPLHEYADGRPLEAILARRRYASQAGEVSRSLRSMRETSGLVDNSDEYLALFERCFRGEPSGLRCYAPYTSLVVDCYGNLYPCVPFNEIDRPVGRLGGGVTVESFWRSREYAKERRELTACQACYWNCHTEMNLVLNRLPGRKGVNGKDETR
jgi:radical SAM protein with 4Fe4S-binding SPASM domain